MEAKRWHEIKRIRESALELAPERRGGDVKTVTTTCLS